MNNRHNWSQQEDNVLKSIVRTNDKVDWNAISAHLNICFGEKNRTAKQCRERYINYACFSEENQSKREWKSQDYVTLFRQFEKYGSSWTRISESLSGKSENAIKNKFYGALRKTVRRMNLIENCEGKKLKKKLKYQSVMRVIDAASYFQGLDEDLKKQCLKLRQKIFLMALFLLGNDVISQGYQLIERINQFNLKTRSFKSTNLKKANLAHMRQIHNQNKYSQIQNQDPVQIKKKHQNIQNNQQQQLQQIKETKKNQNYEQLPQKNQQESFIWTKQKKNQFFSTQQYLMQYPESVQINQQKNYNLRNQDIFLNDSLFDNIAQEEINFF